MAKIFHADELVVDFARNLAESTDSLDLFKKSLSVTLADQGLTTNEIAKQLRVTERTVFNYRSVMTELAKSNGAMTRVPRGGRHRCLMTVEEEEAFLSKYADLSIKGEIVTVKSIHNDLNNRFGRLINKTIVYRLLERHNWRKVSPDTRYPKSSPEERPEFVKKNCRCYWLPPVKKT
jgi:transposase